MGRLLVGSLSANFEWGTLRGIPLNFYPEGSTGIDTLVTLYQLPLEDKVGWKYIPMDSVERVWAQARAKSEAVAKLQKP